MAILRKSNLRGPEGRHREGAKGRAAEDLLQHARTLRPQLVAFSSSAWGFHKLLARDVSSAEIALLATPEADLLGSLELLLNSDLEDVIKKLDEVEAFLAPRRPRQGLAGKGKRGEGSKRARRAAIKR